MQEIIFPKEVEKFLIECGNTDLKYYQFPDLVFVNIDDKWFITDKKSI